MGDFVGWLDAVSGSEWWWYAKYLSANDTLANGTHQAGPYLPNAVIFALFPSLQLSSDPNPRVSFAMRIDSSADDERSVTAIWYNNRVLGRGTRNEARITNWGGRASAILDSEATGSLCVLAFRQRPARDAEYCRVWKCNEPHEEELFIDRAQQVVEPGAGVFLNAIGLRRPILQKPTNSDCIPSQFDIPTSHERPFPDATQLVEWSIGRRLLADRSPDERLVKRRTCEFEAFRAIEERSVLPRVREGFDSVDAFVAYAGAVTNRRKSRSGASLELHTRSILDEEGVRYSWNEISESHKRPDFLFPSSEAYQDRAYDETRLAMLAVKTTCKDRWRQILDEADRIERKHLLTLQEGVSTTQYAQMSHAGVVLVVPAGVHSSFPQSIRGELLSLESFIAEMRAHNG